MAAVQLGNIRPLRDLLVEIGRLDRAKREVRGWLFLPKDRQWTLESPAVLLHLSEVPPEMEDDGEEAETPELAKIHGLKCFLYGADIRDIIDNARQQKPDADLDEIFGAIIYYHRFDAFKDMCEEP
jgi:hypothetical protein